MGDWPTEKIGLLVIFFVMAIGVPLTLILRLRIINEVNQKLPPNKRFSHFLSWRGGPFELYAFHKKFYPQSKKRLGELACYAFVFVVLWILWGLRMLR